MIFSNVCIPIGYFFFSISSFKHFAHKDNANRAQYKINNEVFIFIVEVQLILSKDNANEWNIKIKLVLILFSRVQLILSRDNANRAQYKINKDRKSVV